MRALHLRGSLYSQCRLVRLAMHNIIHNTHLSAAQKNVSTVTSGKAPMPYMISWCSTLNALMLGYHHFCYILKSWTHEPFPIHSAWLLSWHSIS
jgi:hypothetical protein